jgi:hypothetical protein
MTTSASEKRARSQASAGSPKACISAMDVAVMTVMPMRFRGEGGE